MPTSLKLIVGLGNPGSEYSETRHNAGFWFLDRLAADHRVAFSADRKYHGDTARLVSEATDYRLLKPQTYMNKSGRAVQAVSAYYNIKPEEILVVHDEIDLDTGVVRWDHLAWAAALNLAWAAAAVLLFARQFRVARERGALLSIGE